MVITHSLKNDTLYRISAFLNQPDKGATYTLLGEITLVRGVATRDQPGPGRRCWDGNAIRTISNIRNRDRTAVMVDP
uniref:Single-stranded DNA binding protein n=1 Tax=Romanomermis culicivorax TaxID=13658 RepID=A0A915I0Y9_ROMCU